MQLPHAPFAHACDPGLQAPTLLPQTCTAPFRQVHPSSVVPLQSSSAPLHVSGPGSTAPVHALHAPWVHAWVPCRHAPTPLPHKRTTPSVHAHPSSTCPSQFSSTCPSHVSGPGPTPPRHEPHAPCTHVWLPE